MCSMTRVHQAPAIARTNGRPVLQQHPCNQIPSPERRILLAKKLIPPRSPPQLPNTTADSPYNPTTIHLAPADYAKPALTPPISPKKKMPRISTLKRGNDPTTASSTLSCPDKVLAPQHTIRLTKRSVGQALPPSPDALLTRSPSAPPGSIAAARKEQIASLQEQRKLKIAHYGRVKPFKHGGKVVPLNPSSALAVADREEKRCSFITASSGIDKRNPITSIAPKLVRSKCWYVVSSLVMPVQILSTSLTMIKNGESPSMMTGIVCLPHSASFGVYVCAWPRIGLWRAEICLSCWY